MRRTAAVAYVAGLGVAITLSSGGAAPAGTGSELEGFAFAIGNGTLGGSNATLSQRFAPFDLVVVDGEEASAGQVEAIRSQGPQVLAYLSVGTIESWRSWYPRLKRYRLAAWRDWRDEWFADTSKAGLRRRLKRVADEVILPKGFDGLFLDNVDMVEVAKHRPQRRGMGMLVAKLDSVVGDGLLFAQNGARGVLTGYPARGVDPLAGYLDGWNREDVTWTFDFDRRRYVRNPARERGRALGELEEMAGLGLVTTATDYVRLDDGISAGECEAVGNAEAAGALPYLADIGLTRKAVEANPPTC